MSNSFLFLVTVPNMEEGKKIARILVENKLAACVNIVPGICSIYEWKEKIEEDDELLLIIKTTEKRSDQIIEKVLENHPYEVPECIGFRIERGSESYLKWIGEIVE